MVPRRRGHETSLGKICAPNGSSGFRVTGMFPFNQNINPDLFFIADNPVIPRVERETRLSASTPISPEIQSHLPHQSQMELIYTNH
jgi:hypothetical protein